MKAVVMKAAGGPEVLQVQEVADPQIQQATEMKVRLYAAGINPIDIKIRQRGLFYPEALPAILGCDGAGIVEAVGAAVQSFQVGDRVYFCNGGLGGDPGTYAERVVIDERFAAPMPRSLSFVEAAALPLALITASEALFDRGRLSSGQKLFIQAGAGGVGHLAIQLAKQAGARVCTTVSSAPKADFVRHLGADQVILYRQTDPAKAVLDWTGGAGVDLAFDTVGGSSLSQCFAATRIYGDVVTLLAPDAQTDWKTARDRNLRVSYELMLTPMLRGLVQAQAAQAGILRQVTEKFDQHPLQIQVQQTYDLATAAQAHHDLEAGSLMGKLVLDLASNP